MIYEEVAYAINLSSLYEIIFPELIPHKAYTFLNSDYNSERGW